MILSMSKGQYRFRVLHKGSYSNGNDEEYVSCQKPTQLIEAGMHTCMYQIAARTFFPEKEYGDRGSITDNDPKRKQCDVLKNTTA